MSTMDKARAFMFVGLVAFSLGSTLKVMEKLVTMSREMELHATAAHFIIRRIQDDMWLFSSSAGHWPFYIIKRDVPAVVGFPKASVPSNCGMLGLPNNPEFAEDSVLVDEGDLIVCFTDGISESGEGEKPFGQCGIFREVFDKLDEDLESIAHAIMQGAEQAANGHLEDDATVMVLRIKKQKTAGQKTRPT